MILAIVLGLLLAYLTYIVLGKIVDGTIAGIVAVLVFVVIVFGGSGVV